jgi:hypothetical protein
MKMRGHFQKVCKRFADLLKIDGQKGEFFSPFFRICIFPFFFEKSLQIQKYREKNSRFWTSFFKKSANSPGKVRDFAPLGQKKKKIFFLKKKKKINARAKIFSV